jgi:hypothetical protein
MGHDGGHQFSSQNVITDGPVKRAEARELELPGLVQLFPELGQGEEQVGNAS